MKCAYRTNWAAAILAFAILAPLARSDEPSSRDGRPRAADEAASLSYSPPTWPDAPDTSAMLKRLVFGTATVLGLCVSTLWIGRRWLNGAPVKTGQAGNLRVLDSVSVQNRCSVHLLQVGSHQVLVGVDAAGVKTMLALPQPFESTLGELPADADGAASGERLGEPR